MLRTKACRGFIGNSGVGVSKGFEFMGDHVKIALFDGEARPSPCPLPAYPERVIEVRDFLLFVCTRLRVACGGRRSAGRDDENGVAFWFWLRTPVPMPEGFMSFPLMGWYPRWVVGVVVGALML